MLNRVFFFIKDKMFGFFSWSLVFIMVLGSSLLMLSTSLQESAIMDELAHIPAGYSYSRFLDYRLNPEHPPLIKALAAIPLLFKDLNFPLENKIWKEEVNGQWGAGNQFIYWNNGQRADEIIFWSRIFPIILTLILIIFVYWWSKELLGRWWALIPTFLVAFSPHFLAHGHYLTTDVGAALGFFIGLYFFVKQLTNPSKKNTIWAGIFFGLAQLMKFSLVLLIPIYILLLVIWWLISSKERGFSFLSRNSLLLFWDFLKSFLIILAIGYLIVWLAYFIFTINYPIEKQKLDTESTLNSFAGGPDPEGNSCRLSSLSPRCLANLDIWMAGVPILRGLGHYFLGVLMVMQRSAGGNTAYFLGEVSGGGWWNYFPAVFLLKESLPALILVFVGFLAGLGRIFIRKYRQSSSLKNYLTLNFAEFSMLAMVIFYWLYSVKSPLNIGFRHILPTIPFIYILTTGSFKKWLDSRLGREIGWSVTVRKITSKHLKVLFLLLMLIWVFIETMSASPYFLSYFNEIGGGVRYGYRSVTDSNYDWGQDLIRLKKWVEQNLPAGRQVEKIAVDYFGGGDIKYYLGEKAEGWRSSRGNPADSNIDWLAVSVNTLQSATARTKNFERKPEDEYSWLSSYDQPYARVGTSIFIYRLR